MRIVQLDSHAANPGDMAWEPWRNIATADGGVCEFVHYERTAPDEVVERAKDADIVVVNKVLMTDAVMAQLPRLRYIGVLATGYNVVDTEAARRRGITVTNVPEYGTASVAQMVFAHLLDIANGVALHSDAVRDGAWGGCPDFTFTLTPQTELSGKTFGIIGYGATGKATARIAEAFGMRVLLAPSLREAPSTPPPTGEALRAATLDDFFRETDIVSLHCPLTERTRHIVNARTLALMKPTAILINTGRGALVDEQALADALNSGAIAAAGVDVLEEEPPVSGSPLMTARNCRITPHIAWATLAARQRLVSTATDNIRAFIEGRPVNECRM